MEVNDDSFTYTFGRGTGNSWTITGKNHEYEGLCFWVFEKKLEVFNSFHETLMLCSLFDSYGNEAKLSIKISQIDRTTLEAYVI
ncbi:hypothetical protein QNH98_00320 [Myroides sp. mNGS23_01]|nr:hypothetical protein [Myroides sp. mNGS23_01]WHT39209.1 hypothetical protein QNH98_00320 [Myroides sp. mNGS23_01]